jgi:hypothetical protein
MCRRFGGAPRDSAASLPVFANGRSFRFLKERNSGDTTSAPSFSDLREPREELDISRATGSAARFSSNK